MEDPEEFMGSNNNDHNQQNQMMHHVKGKRTKRLRSSLSSSPNSAGVAITSSSSSGSTCGGDSRGGGGEDLASISSLTSSTTTASEEEEDMANCLILLAQGDSQKQVLNNDHEEEREDHHGISGKSNIIIHRAKANSLYVYECKTCNRNFPSFQALGGHRASHKKPKSTITAALGPTPAAATTTEEIVKRVPIFMPKGEVEEAVVVPNKGTTISTNLVLHGNNNKGTKIHECSICGLEFMSGQALGGHMRRHRAAATTATANIVRSGPTMDTEIKRSRNILQLDLNLPALEDELSSRENNKFQLIASSQQQSIVVFSSTPTLVDCYY